MRFITLTDMRRYKSVRTVRVRIFVRIHSGITNVLGDGLISYIRRSESRRE
jgi:hypothetical protein